MSSETIGIDFFNNHIYLNTAMPKPNLMGLYLQFDPIYINIALSKYKYNIIKNNLLPIKLQSCMRNISITQFDEIKKPIPIKTAFSKTLFTVTFNSNHSFYLNSAFPSPFFFYYHNIDKSLTIKTKINRPIHFNNNEINNSIDLKPVFLKPIFSQINKIGLPITVNIPVLQISLGVGYRLKRQMI